MIDDAELERLASVQPRLGHNDIVQHARLRGAVRVYLGRVE